MVSRIERELGRTARPFEWRMDILAVREPPVVIERDHYAAISGALLAAESEYRDWLYGSLRRIA